jgi:phosphate butyryltransferase
MIFNCFAKIEEYVLNNGKQRTIALAGSHGKDILASVAAAQKRGIADFVLIGDAEKTKRIAAEMEDCSIDLSGMVNVPDNEAAAHLACDIVSCGKADIIMKGAMHTYQFMHALLDKSLCLIENNNMLSQITIFEYPPMERIMLITDCAINISPDFNGKMKILKNAVKVARRIGIDCPKVAAIAPIETVNMSIPATVDAALLEKASKSCQIKNCTVEGPISFDSAVSRECALLREMEYTICGDADILLMPDLCSGNAMTKAFTYMFSLPTAGIVAGAKIPVIMTSLMTPQMNKYNSILTAVFESLVSE